MILKNTNVQLFISKIKYLLEQNKPLVINNLLNPLFSMSNVDMYELFNITNQDLLKKYREKESSYNGR